MNVLCRLGVHWWRHVASMPQDVTVSFYRTTLVETIERCHWCNRTRAYHRSLGTPRNPT